MATSKVKKQTAIAVDLPECPVCLDPMSAPIFQCQSGHSLCSTCTNSLRPPSCPICRQPMTQMRNWQLEDIIAKAKVPCPNKSDGCVYTMAARDVEGHLKECIFRTMDCPLGAVFGRCSWHGKLSNMMDHFKERHANNCNVTSDTEVELTNVNVNDDDRYFYLVAQAKLLFILTMKIDTLQKMAYWTVQHIGSRKLAEQHIYEVHMTSKQNPRRKVVFIESCFNDTIKAEEIFRKAKCAIIPLDVLKNFIKDKQLSFRFYIKRLPSPSKNNADAMVHCNKRGSEMLCGDLSHVYKREGGTAHLAGVLMTGLKNLPDGTFDIEDMGRHIRGSDIHEPVTMMVAVENTHSYCGGRVLPLAWLEKLSALTKKHALALHMDGARLFNASEYLGEQPSRLARDCDSVSVCFSKGLGAPVGSALAGTRRFIDQARRFRKMLGGGMRQAGVIAACGLVALEETVPGLTADHRRAHYLAKAIRDLKLSTFTVDVDHQQTNIVHVSGKSSQISQKVTERLSVVSQSEARDCKTSDGKGITVLGTVKPDANTLRFVLHRDIDDDDLKLAVKKIAFVLKEADKNK